MNDADLRRFINSLIFDIRIHVEETNLLLPLWPIKALRNDFMYGYHPGSEELMLMLWRHHPRAYIVKPERIEMDGNITILYISSNIYKKIDDWLVSALPGLPDIIEEMRVAAGQHNN